MKLKRIFLLFQKDQLKFWRCPFQLRQNNTDDPWSWADRVADESHNDEPARSIYPSHVRSEVDSFHGVLPNTTLGELSSTEQSRLFRLNGLPDRPCSAHFKLPEHTIDSRIILGKIVSIGIQGRHVKCIQRFRSGQVAVTFCRKTDRDLFLSKVALCFPAPFSLRPSSI